jgi:hypothetical protein
MQLPSVSPRARPLLLAAALIGVIVGCEQNLESGLACPALCPQQTDSLLDTTFYAVEYDTSVSGYPTTGSERELLLTNDPANDLRAIVRFDTLQSTFRHHGSSLDSAIVALPYAVLKLLIAKPDTVGPPVTFEVYDMETDSTVDDTTSAVLTPLFGVSLLGSVTVPRDSLKDSVLVPLDTVRMLAKIQTLPYGTLRVGIRIASAQPVEMSIYSTNGGFSPHLFMRASPDSTVDSITVAPYSRTPLDDATMQLELRDFQLVASPTPVPGLDAIRVGGIPGRRAYLRFNIPSKILDSSSVVRASLVLTQKPNPSSPRASDTAGIVPFELGSGTAVTDLKRILVFLSLGMDSIGVAPKDSGTKTIEMIDALRHWRLTTPERTPRAIALRATLEGLSAWQADFYSQRAAISVRPRLHITYMPLLKSGLP